MRKKKKKRRKFYQIIKQKCSHLSSYPENTAILLMNGPKSEQALVTLTMRSRNSSDTLIAEGVVRYAFSPTFIPTCNWTVLLAEFRTLTEPDGIFVADENVCMFYLLVCLCYF